MLFYLRGCIVSDSSTATPLHVKLEVIGLTSEYLRNRILA